jgi:hypothetical protein
MSDFTVANPPTSSQDTLGIFGAPMLSEYAILAFSSAVSKSAAVTATPAFITSTSLLFLKDEFRENKKTKDSTYDTLLARSIDIDSARCTRLTMSPATKAAVSVAILESDTSGARTVPASNDRRIS